MSARREVLRVLDAEAAVARAVLARDALEDVEQRRVRPVADRVHDDLQAGLVGAGDPRVEIFGRVDQAGRGRCGASVNGSWNAAVCEPSEPSTKPLSPPISQPLVAAAIRPPYVFAATASRSRSQLSSGTAA